MSTPSQPSPGPADIPPVDFEQLNAASGEDMDMLKELVHLYFDQAKELMTGLQTALAAKDAKQTDYFAHKFAGASLACGVTVMVAPLRAMEAKGRAGDVTGCETYLQQATTNLEIARQAIEEFLKAHPGG